MPSRLLSLAEDDSPRIVTRDGVLVIKAQAHRSQDLEGSDGLDGAGAEVFDPSPARGGGQLLLGQDQLDGTAGQEGNGRRNVGRLTQNH